MKKNILKFRLIRLERNGCHPVCSITINGTKARFVVDTGASHTVMDLNRIHQFVNAAAIQLNPELSTGLGTSSMQSSMVKIKALQLDKKELKKFKMILLDLSHINNTYQALGFPPIDGVIGTDILNKFKATISFASKTITFNT